MGTVHAIGDLGRVSASVVGDESGDGVSGIDCMMGIGDIVVSNLPGSEGRVVVIGTDGPVPSIKSAPKTPAPAKPVKAAWMHDGRYILQRGDTLWGLATTYLQAGGRWREIWSIQDAGYKSSGCGPFPKRSPDHICEGDIIFTTKEMQDRARALGLLPWWTPAKMGIAALATAAGGAVAYYFGANG